MIMADEEKDKTKKKEDEKDEKEKDENDAEKEGEESEETTEAPDEVEKPEDLGAKLDIPKVEVLSFYDFVVQNFGQDDADNLGLTPEEDAGEETEDTGLENQPEQSDEIQIANTGDETAAEVPAEAPVEAEGVAGGTGEAPAEEPAPQV